MTEQEALAKAVEAGCWSPCAKSKRGVVIWRRGGGVLAQGFNTPPPGFKCDGSPGCRRDCGKVCIHAEVYAILDAGNYGKGIQGAEMLHVKVVDGKAVPSGPPSCWQCSRELIKAGLTFMWLLEPGDPDPVLRRYGVDEFHELTLRNCRLHPFGAA